MNSMILVPLDGSRFAESAVATAITLAKRLDTGLTFISMFDETPVALGWPVTSIPQRDAIVRYHARLMESVASDFDGPTFSIVSEGPVARTLVERIESEDPTAVVMATHGRGPVSRFWLGSVADHVLRYVNVPVMLAPSRHDETDDTAHLDRARSVLVPVDGSPLAEIAVEWVTRSLPEAELTLLRVVPPPFEPSPYLPHAIEETEAWIEAERADAREYLDALAARLADRGTIAEIRTVVGATPPAAIVEAAQAHEIDFIAIGSHGHSGWKRTMLGSVADKVVRGAHVPVLVIPATYDADTSAPAAKRRAVANA